MERRRVCPRERKRQSHRQAVDGRKDKQRAGTLSAMTDRGCYAAAAAPQDPLAQGRKRSSVGNPNPPRSQSSAYTAAPTSPVHNE
jgi:hypothetical protein